MYTLTEQQADNCYEAKGNTEAEYKAVIDILENIAYYSANQEELTENLTLLRNAAIKSNKKSIFDRCYDMAQEGAIDQNSMKGLTLRFNYTKEDFMYSDEPYKEIFFQPTSFHKQRTLERLSVEANKCGYKSFKNTYKAFEKSMCKGNQSTSTALNPSDFPDQPIELECGEWHCDADGIMKIYNDRIEYACLHPIMPVERLINIDTGEEKLRVYFRNGNYWRDFIASKFDLYDASKILKFSALGVAVTSSTAKHLSRYFCDVETLNHDKLKQIESVGRLGWIGEQKKQFSPYVDNLIFDGDVNYGTIYEAICANGDYTKWLAEAQKCRSESLTAQIMLAASFASPLIIKLNVLPFFVHLWGVESGTGKTVALMLAASVWGNPDIGSYIQTFNSTQVSCERTAAFLNNIPLCIDELQLSKDSHGKSRFDVYQLAQGVGRGRGTRTGGLEKVPQWRLCILTTGESPLTNESNGAGAINRVIDIECKASESVIKDGYSTSSIVKQHYGHAGKQFIEALTEAEIKAAKNRYEELFRELSSGPTTEKQAMAAAVLILADELADKFIFKTGKVLTIEDISIFLKEKLEVSAGQRAYNLLCDWVTINENRFQDSDNNGEFWGKVDEYENKVSIISSVFRDILTSNGFDERAVLSWLKANCLIETPKNGRAFTKYTSVDNHKARYVVMRLPEEDVEVPDGFELL